MIINIVLDIYDHYLCGPRYVIRYGHDRYCRQYIIFKTQNHQKPKKIENEYFFYWSRHRIQHTWTNNPTEHRNTWYDIVLA